ncbi:aminoacyl-tRNA deacylase [Flocculibacter collagenilyticus]|uniref:aminoacyl-tRNA deacylase n=1 Tax=Flocculibacter collagenilyticus TaxID=2744479 RepID=UPI0018F5CF72|nr:YbaK/EbsC family protein [Flocculibacter collagenilyticus]
MTVANRVYSYLKNNQIPFDVVEHPHSNNSLSTAISSQIPFANIAKAVMLADHEGKKVMAVLPGNNKISLSKLNDATHREFHLINEQEVFKLFSDCEHGAVPPVAKAYEMDAVYDEALFDQADVYLEAGDHQTLIHLSHSDFIKLTKGYKTAHFSSQVFH